MSVKASSDNLTLAREVRHAAIWDLAWLLQLLNISWQYNHGMTDGAARLGRPVMVATSGACILAVLLHASAKGVHGVSMKSMDYLQLVHRHEGWEVPVKRRYLDWGEVMILVEGCADIAYWRAGLHSRL